jgi:exopolyphosphatase/guanosine-5'-triphosphate,3'-diphosphate pyrophosphatase
VSPPRRLAAIDVGSNTILLLIAEYSPATGLRILQEDGEQPRLAAGLGATGRLSEESMRRALQSLIRMRDLCGSLGVRQLRAVATAAVREAENGREFARRARDQDIPLEIISPEAEAELAYRAAAHHFPATRMLVADIGGGSLELIGGADGRIELVRSLPLGAVRLTELALTVVRLRDRVRAALGESVLRQDWAGSRVIGSGGTFASAAAMILARRGSAGQPIQGLTVGREELEDLIGTLSAMTPEQRRQVPGLPPERADIIVAGLVVAAELLDRLEAADVRINQYGLREGLLLDLVASY